MHPRRAACLLPILALLPACAAKDLRFETRPGQSWTDKVEIVARSGAVALEWHEGGPPRLLQIDIIEQREVRKTLVETWRFVETDTGRKGERKVKEELREEVLSAVEEQRISGAYNGPLQVSVRAGDWSSEGSLRVEQGEVTALENLPFAPLDVLSPAVSFEAVGFDLVTDRDHGELYAYLLERAVALVDQAASSTTLRSTWNHWMAPRRFSVRLTALDLPESASDPAPFKRPEPFVRAERNGESLGCTPILGKDLPGDRYLFPVESVLVADFRRVDSLTLLVLDEDLSSHDVLGSWPAPLESGTAGWLEIEVERAPDLVPIRLGPCPDDP